MKIKFFLFGAVLIILIIFLGNACILDNYFLGDGLRIFSSERLDKYFLIKNSPDLWFTTFVEDLFSPIHDYLTIIPGLSFRGNYLFFGTNPLGYHLVIVISHIINSILVLFFILLILKNRYLSLFIAILFAINPINSELVSSTVYRAYVFSMTFSLISLIAFILFHQQKRKIYYLLSLISFFAALFCKETALALPFIIVVLHSVLDNKESFSRPRTRINRFKLYIPYFVIFALYLVIRIPTLDKWGGYGFLVKGYPEFYWVFKDHGLFKGMLTYLLRTMFKPYKFLLFPVNMFIFKDYILVIKLLTLFIIFIPISITAIFNFKKFFNKVTIFGLLFVFFSSIPIFFLLNSIDYNQGGLVNSRYLYLPSIGFAIIVGNSLWSFTRKKVIYRFLRHGLIFSVIIFYFMLLKGNNLAWDKAAMVSYEIAHQTKMAYPMSPESKRVIYYIPQGDELYHSEGIQLYLNGGIDTSLSIAYGFPVEAYILDKKKFYQNKRDYKSPWNAETFDRMQKIIDNLDLRKAISNSYVLGWNPSENKIEDLSLILKQIEESYY